MSRFVHLAATGLLLALVLPDDLAAHGGIYLGPRDTVPGNPGGGGGRSPGPTGPSTPGTGGPATPGPGGPGSPGVGGPGTGGPGVPGVPGPGGPFTPGGLTMLDDLSQWHYWWEFNKDPYLNLREAVFDPGVVSVSEEFYMGGGRESVAKDSLRPSPVVIRDRLVPALARALNSTDQRDITSSCMVALAKIGESTERFQLLPALRERLRRGDQEIRETAALAMGIAQLPEAVPDLVALLGDTPAGARLTDRGSVDPRTRAFAAFGLALIANSTSDQAVKRQVFVALEASLRDDAARNRNIRVPVIHAIGLLRPDPTSADGRALLHDCATALQEYWQLRLGAGRQLIQAHVPTSLAKLFQDIDLGADAEFRALFEDLRAQWLEQLTRVDETRSSVDLDRSAILALGRSTAPNQGKDATPDFDLKVSKVLQRYADAGKDEQARHFAVLSLGLIGGDANRNFLIQELETGSKAIEKPWAALALGVLARASYDRDPNAPTDRLIGDRLRSWLTKVKTPGTLSALAVGLGLARCNDAADQLRSMLEKYKNQDDLAGYICIGLALMDDQRSGEQFRSLVETSVRRPTRLLQAAVALGKIGDKSAAELLTTLLRQGGTNLAKMSSLASALGYIGDRRSIEPLLQMLFDEGLTDLTRAFAAVALGGIADKELLPWNTKFKVHTNYRANVETLTNQVSGVLDIL